MTVDHGSEVNGNTAYDQWRGRQRRGDIFGGAGGEGSGGNASGGGIYVDTGTVTIDNARTSMAAARSATPVALVGWRRWSIDSGRRAGSDGGSGRGSSVCHPARF